MFKRTSSSKSAWGVSDPLKRQFLAGLFVGSVIGMGLTKLLDSLFG